MNEILQFIEVLLLGIFAVKKWLVFIYLTSFGTLKYDWVIKTREILISYFLYQDYNHQYFYRHHAYHLNIQEKHYDL